MQLQLPLVQVQSFGPLHPQLLDPHPQPIVMILVEVRILEFVVFAKYYGKCSVDSLPQVTILDEGKKKNEARGRRTENI